MGVQNTALQAARALAECERLAPDREYQRASLLVLLAIERRLASLEALARAGRPEAKRAPRTKAAS